VKLKAKIIEISTGNIKVAILNRKDAEAFDLYPLDRLVLKKGSKTTIAVLDIADSEKVIKPGRIGLFEETMKQLGAKNNSKITFSLEKKPRSVSYIKKKMDGKHLTFEEIYEIIDDIANDKLSDVELTLFVSVGYTHGWSMKEKIALTRAMIETGDMLKFKDKTVVDLHCIGGVAGNRTTMIIVPIIAAAGFVFPKTCSRAITSPSGTADTMEVFCNVSLDRNALQKVVDKAGACITWGGAVNLAPADDKIIRIEHPLDINTESQMLSSIMAKKGSVSATNLFIDIPVGKEAKIKSNKNALKLRRKFIQIGKYLGMKVDVFITDGNQPIGNGIGCNLEARDVLYILKDDIRAPTDLKEKSLLMAGHMLEILGKAKPGYGYELAEDILEDKRALKKFEEIIKAQQGSLINPDKIPLAEYKYTYNAKRSGIVRELSNHSIAKIAKLAGTPNDKDAGVYLHAHEGTEVKKGDPLLDIYSNSKEKLNYAKEILEKKKCFCIK